MARIVPKVSTREWAGRRRIHVWGSNLRTRIILTYALLIGVNLLAWIWAYAAFRSDFRLLGTALLAYSFGLRHAVDADHIAAIDNVTRKLMQDGKRPTGVGLFFALGHSTVVVVASLVLALAAAKLKGRWDAYKYAGGLIGTSISAFFLFAIAIANLLVLVSVYRAFRRVREGKAVVEEDLDILLSQRGLLARLFRRMLRLISKSWLMYPMGFLFGLGFETATEIALLGIASSEASKGLPIWSTMVFPALFTAGMSLIDTTDGIVMLGAYGWAFEKPIRKLFYNMAITLLSILVALVVGGIEALSLLGDHLDLRGAVWTAVDVVSDNFSIFGYSIIGIFAVSWITSMAIYRVKRF